MSSPARYQASLTAEARRDLLVFAVTFYRQWGVTLGIDWPETLNLIHNWIREPLESNPYSEHSQLIGNTNVRYWTQDKGLYFGSISSGYIVVDEELKCRIILIQANAELDTFVSAAIQRATMLGAPYRDT